MKLCEIKGRFGGLLLSTTGCWSRFGLAIGFMGIFGAPVKHLHCLHITIMWLCVDVFAGDRREVKV